MFPIKEFERRFREILDEADAIREAAEEWSENLDELNADFEDALFVIESIEDGDEDWRDAFSDALAEFRDIAEAYGKQPNRELKELAERLEMAVKLAEKNIKE